MRKTLTVLVCLNLILLAAGCRRSTEEDRVKAVITTIQKAAEEKDIGEVLEHLSKTYRDPQGHDYNGIKGLLLMYFYRHQRVSIYIPGIEAIVTEASARAVFEAVLTGAGTPESRPGMLPEALGVYSFDLTLKKEGKDWKVLSAAWQRSGEGGR